MLYNALLYSELFPNIDVVKQDVNYIRATRIRNLFLNIICWWKECCIIYQGMVRFNMDNNVININKSEYINQHGFCVNSNIFLFLTLSDDASLNYKIVLVYFVDRNK